MVTMCPRASKKCCFSGKYLHFSLCLIMFLIILIYNFSPLLKYLPFSAISYCRSFPIFHWIPLIFHHRCYYFKDFKGFLRAMLEKQHFFVPQPTIATLPPLDLTLLYFIWSMDWKLTRKTGRVLVCFDRNKNKLWTSLFTPTEKHENISITHQKNPESVMFAIIFHG